MSRRSEAEQWMEAGLARGWSGTATLEWLRTMELGYRMTLFFEDWRRLQGIAIQVPYVKRLDPDEFIPRTWAAEVDLARWHQPESLRYRMEALFRDPETGEESIEFKALMTNRERSLAEITQIARDKFPWDAYGDGRELIGLEVVGLYHLKGTPY